MIIVYNGNPKIMEEFNRFVYIVQMYGHQTSTFIIGERDYEGKDLIV